MVCIIILSTSESNLCMVPTTFKACMTLLLIGWHRQSNPLSLETRFFGTINLIQRRVLQSSQKHKPHVYQAFFSHIKRHRIHSSKYVHFIAIETCLDINQCATSWTVWIVPDRGWYKCECECECFRMQHWCMNEDIKKMWLSSKCVGNNKCRVDSIDNIFCNFSFNLNERTNERTILGCEKLYYFCGHYFLPMI